MTEPPTPSRRRSGWIVVALVVLAYPLYQGVMFGVRAYVDARIANAQGMVLEFELRDTAGRMHRAADLRGKRVVLNFFRSRCVGCRIEAPAIKEFARQLGGDVAIFGVLMDRVEGYPEAVTAATLAEFGYAHPVLHADAAFVDRFHGAGWAHVTPITYFADRDGRVYETLRGHQTLDALQAALSEGR